MLFVFVEYVNNPRPKETRKGAADSFFVCSCMWACRPGSGTAEKPKATHNKQMMPVMETLCRKPAQHANVEDTAL